MALPQGDRTLPQKYLASPSRLPQNNYKCVKMKANLTISVSKIAKIAKFYLFLFTFCLPKIIFLPLPPPPPLHNTFNTDFAGFSCIPFDKNQLTCQNLK